MRSTSGNVGGVFFWGKILSITKTKVKKKTSATTDVLDMILKN